MLPLLLLFTSLAFAADWPRFRGPNGSGVGEATGLPVEFGPSRNAAWKTSVPFGRSSPIVAGGRVFLTASEGGKLITLAYDVVTGREQWRRTVDAVHSHKIYKSNDAASPTPAADGNNVYAFFPDFGLVSYTFSGKERWRHKLGPFENFYGMSSSPVIDKGLLFLLCDQAQGSYLLALDKDTGKQRWKTERKGMPVGWSVPIVHEDQILVFGSIRVESYFLATGEQGWWIPVSSFGSMGSPVVHAGALIVTASGSEQPWMPSFESTLAKSDQNKDGLLSSEETKDLKEWFEHFGWVDANHDKQLNAAEWNTARMFGVGDYGAVSIPLGGKGRLDSASIRWRFKRNLPYVPAPVLYDGVFYMVKDGGIVTSLDPATGTLLKQGRSEKALGQYFASPVAADGKVFLLSEEGKLTVLKAAPQWEVISVNDLEEECYATPAVTGGGIFVRTRGMLYRFALR
ncbi:MAG: PQQ-binding-like beta-propeller repeat protein [Acidobacteriia bacterium]|nr:PQQ-binding-like beta-propeller repeat protein [Terriglobia bacterium]